MKAARSIRNKKVLFEKKMIGILNDGALALMTSIGHQTGLFDAMAKLQTANSRRIAATAKLSERYVREWLCAMVSGGIVKCDARAQIYWLPKEHAACLVRSANANNLALLTQYIPVLGSVEGDVIGGFRSGKGVGYSIYDKFLKLLSQDSSMVIDATLLQETLPLINGMMAKLQVGANVADIGCGCGHALNIMAKAFPKSLFTGYDLSRDSIVYARAEAKRMKLTNVRFIAKDAARMRKYRYYDLITAFDSIHDQARPKAVLRSIARALKLDGTYLMAEIASRGNAYKDRANLLGPFLYTVSTMHCLAVSLGCNGPGLGTMWGDRSIREYLAETGFNQVKVRQVPGDMFNNFYIARKS